MKFCKPLFTLAISSFLVFQGNAGNLIYSQSGNFNKEKDLLLVQFDCKTDVDDIHTVAAFATLLADSNFAGINYHAVAGTYGIQEGLYVPANPLFELAFTVNWTDAHSHRVSAIEQVKEIVTNTLENQGDIWIAEAGQSDFTAALVKEISIVFPELNLTESIHVVQHSKWNEESTSAESLKFVKQYTDYHKIPDGNAVGNGTPGFRDPAYIFVQENISDTRLADIWQLAIDTANKYNGKDGRYNNEAISQGGLDFSDLSEVCWILGLQDIKDVAHFFALYGN